MNTIVHRYYEDIFLDNRRSVNSQTLKSPAWFSKYVQYSDVPYDVSTITCCRPYTMEHCEVDDPALYDEELASMGGYKNLPKIRLVSFVTSEFNLISYSGFAMWWLLESIFLMAVKKLSPQVGISGVTSSQIMWSTLFFFPLQHKILCVSYQSGSVFIDFCSRWSLCQSLSY